MKQKQATVNAVKQRATSESPRDNLEHFPVLNGLKMLTADWSLHESWSTVRFGERLI